MSKAPKIVALGAGRMGRGIAQVFAYAGHDVTILDFKERDVTDSDALLAAGKADFRRWQLVPCDLIEKGHGLGQGDIGQGVIGWA